MFFIKRLALISSIGYALLFGSGCTTYSKSHVVQWVGAFMIDSVTAGAVRLEYTDETPQNNTYGGGDTYGIKQKLFTYDFISKKFTDVIVLKEGLEDPPFGNNVDFNYPYLLYLTEDKSSRATAIYDIIKRKNILITPFLGVFISSNNKYLVNNTNYFNIETRERQPIPNIDANLFFFDDSTKLAYGLLSSLRNPPYPIICFGKTEASNDTIGFYKNWHIFQRVSSNKYALAASYGKYETIDISALKNKIFKADSIQLPNLKTSVMGFDFNEKTGNYVAFGRNTYSTLVLGNLKNVFPTEQINPDSVEYL